MRTSENESEKAGLISGKIINGWWRIWVVISCIWIIFAVVYSVAGWIDEGLNKDTAKHHQIYQQLDYTNKSIVFEIESQAPATDIQRVEIINEDIIIPFKPGIAENKMLEFADLYCKIGNQIQSGNRTKYILIALTFLILPPFLIAAIGVSVGWIVKGFKNN